jgi:hypothetical protein
MARRRASVMSKDGLGAVEYEMQGTFRGGETEIDFELLATSGDGGVVGSFEVKSHQQ